MDIDVRTTPITTLGRSRMLNRLGRPALALSATAVTALMLTACGSNDAPSVSAPSDTASVAPSTPAQTPSAPETAAPTTTSAPKTPSAAPGTPTQKPSKPATGKNVILAKKKQFQVTMPKGWQDIGKKIGDMKIIELAIADGKPSNGTLTNINVASIKLGLSDTKLPAEQSAKKYKEQGDVVKMQPQRKIGGESANGYTKHDKKNTQSQTQWFLSHKGTVYIITLTNHPKSASTADKALGEVISSWTWR
jgi:hypothetical protein